MALAPVPQPTALIYCRVSSAKQEREGASLETQEESCRAKAAELGLTVAAVFREHVSGHEWWDRPQLQTIREEIRTKKHQALIVHCLDRLAREQSTRPLRASFCFPSRGTSPRSSARRSAASCWRGWIRWSQPVNRQASE
jgi:hypothetical protein